MIKRSSRLVSIRILTCKRAEECPKDEQVLVLRGTGHESQVMEVKRSRKSLVLSGFRPATAEEETIDPLDAAHDLAQD